MLKRVLAIMILAVFLFHGVAFAQGSGRIILEDTLYGALIGGILGGAWYLLDEDEFGEKVGTGVGVGAIAGFVLGITDVATLVQIEGDEIKYGMPPVLIEKGKQGAIFKTSLVNVKF